MSSETTTHSTPAEKARGAGAAGMVSWHHSSLSVEDIGPAAAFFEAGFGFRRLFAETGMGAQIEAIAGAPGLRCNLVHLRHPASGHVLELIAFQPQSGPLPADPLPVRPGTAHVAFVVRDLDAAKAAVEALGAVVLGDITEFEEGPALYCRVPGGAFVELEQAPAG